MLTSVRNNSLLLAALLGISPYLVNGYVDAKIAASPLAYWGFEFLIWLLTPSVLFWHLMRSGKLTFGDLGFRQTIFGRRSVLLVVVASVVFCPVAYLIFFEASIYAGALLPADSLFQYQSVVPRGGTMRAVVALYLALTAGFVEEMYFRGLFFKALGSVPAYLLVSPLLFALIHWESGAANSAAAYVYGLATALGFIATRNIWPLIAGHVFTDYMYFG